LKVGFAPPSNPVTTGSARAVPLPFHINGKEAVSDKVEINTYQDNLNTHKSASLYEAFKAPEARRLTRRFEWHYTPKHGSWLNLSWPFYHVNALTGIFQTQKR